ncbi:MAG: hypothetical protein WBM14_10795 [Terracidiphilus sp.]
MWYRPISRFALSAAVLAMAASLALFAQDSTHRGRKYKAPPPTSRIEVTILRFTDGKPIENAAVIFHLLGDKGNMELKTDQDGKTVIDVLPTDSEVLLQVIARGYQTYGEDFKIDKSKMAIEVKLKRPGQQYSIYKHHADTAKDAAPKESSPKDAAPKDASSDKPAESARQDESQPAPAQPQPR